MFGPEIEAKGPDAQQTLDSFMPAAFEAKDDSQREKSKKFKDTSEEEFASKSKGYPKAAEKDDPETYKTCKDKIQQKLDSGDDSVDSGKWVSGIVAIHKRAEYNAKTNKMDERESVMITDNKIGSYRFYRGPVVPRDLTADEKKQVDEKKAANKKEADDANKAELDEQTAKLLKENFADKPAPAKTEGSSDLAKKAAKGLKGSGDWGYADGPNKARALAIMDEDNKIQYFEGTRKA